MEEMVVSNKGNGIINSFSDIERAAKAMSASGFFADSRDAAKAVVKILAGQEMGFGPFASMTGIVLINGKPAVGANLQASAIKRSGKYNYKIVEMSEEAVELEFFESGKPCGKSKFTIDDAKSAGLIEKDVWKKFRRNMLFARALSNGVKWFTPDIFNGATVYTPEELGAVEDGDGNILKVPDEEFSDVVTVKALDFKKESFELCKSLAKEHKLEVEGMIEKYSPSKVFSKIPADKYESLHNDLMEFKKGL